MFVEFLVIAGALVTAAASHSVEKVSLAPKALENGPPLEAIDELIDKYLLGPRSSSEDSLELKDTANEPIIKPTKAGVTRAVHEEIVPQRVVTTPDGGKDRPTIPPYSPPLSIQPFARDVCSQWKCEPYHKNYLKTDLIVHYRQYTYCLDVCEPLLIELWLRNWIEDLVKAQMKYERLPKKQKTTTSEFIKK